MKFVFFAWASIFSACGAATAPPAAPVESRVSSAPTAATATTMALAVSSAADAPAVSAPPQSPSSQAEPSTSGTRGITFAASAGETPTGGARSAAAPALSTNWTARDVNGATRPLVSGDTLRSGDHFWLELSAHEALYVYVIYVSADGSASVLYPSKGDLLLASGSARRLPETQDFELDQHAGLERVLVVASRDVLSRSAGSLAELVNRVRTTHRFPAATKDPQVKAASRATTPAPAAKTASAQGAAAPQPYTGPTNTLEPAYASIDTRGIVLSGSPRGRIDVVPDSDGVIAIPLLIEHSK